MEINAIQIKDKIYSLACPSEIEINNDKIYVQGLPLEKIKGHNLHINTFTNRLYCDDGTLIPTPYYSFNETHGILTKEYSTGQKFYYRLKTSANSFIGYQGVDISKYPGMIPIVGDYVYYEGEKYLYTGIGDLYIQSGYSEEVVFNDMPGFSYSKLFSAKGLYYRFSDRVDEYNWWTGDENTGLKFVAVDKSFEILESNLRDKNFKYKKMITYNTTPCDLPKPILPKPEADIDYIIGFENIDFLQSGIHYIYLTPIQNHKNFYKTVYTYDNDSLKTQNPEDVVIFPQLEKTFWEYIIRKEIKAE